MNNNLIDFEINQTRLDINDIYNYGENIFGFDGLILDDLIIKEKKDTSFRGILYPKPNRNQKSIYYYNSNLNRNERVLNYIHEVYPGHHYYVTLKQINRDKAYKNYENNYFEEGWSRFCEFYYSFYLFNDLELQKTFCSKFLKNIILFMIVYEMAYLGKDIKQMILENTYHGYISKKQLISMYFSICENYNAELSYFIGFMEIYYDFLKDLNVHRIIKKYVLLERV